MITKISINPNKVCVTKMVGDVPKACAEAELMCDEWFVNRVLVKDPDQRNKGIGSEMVEKMLTAIYGQNPDAVVTVLPGGYGENPDEQANFYQKNGFVWEERAEYNIMVHKRRCR